MESADALFADHPRLPRMQIALVNAPSKCESRPVEPCTRTHLRVQNPKVDYQLETKVRDPATGSRSQANRLKKLAELSNACKSMPTRRGRQ